MEANIVTHLTLNAITEALTNPAKRMKVVVQVLDLIEKDLKGKPMYCVKLSDGFYHDTFIIYPQIVDEFKNLIKTYDIIEAGIIVKDSSRSVKLMYEYRPIYGSVNEIIGAPVESPQNPETAINHLGSNEIPQHVLFNIDNDDNQARNAPVMPVRSSGMRIEVNDGHGERRNVVAQPVVPINRQNFDNELYTEIANLNAYDRSWKIKGRVIKKSDLKEFVSKGKDGCVFNIVILDSTRNIQGTFYNDTARQYYGMLQVGKVYSFADGMIKTAGMYNSTDNKLEITFGDKAEIVEKQEDSSIPGFHYNFVKISDIGAKKESDIIDVLAVVQECNPLREVNLRSGENKEVREIVFKDDSNHSISMTLWGTDAVQYDLPKDTIVILQGVMVKEYNGKTLSFLKSAKIIDKIPEMPRYRELLMWRNTHRGGDDNLVNLAGEKTMQKMKLFKVAQMNGESSLLMDDNEDTKLYFSVIVSFVRLLGNLYYDACEDPKCMKKVIRNTYGTYDCEKCNKTFDRPKPRFFCNMKFSDDTDSFVAMVNGDDNAKIFFDRTIDELKELKNGSESDFADFMRTKQFTEYKLRVMAKKEFYMSDAKIKFSVNKVTKIEKTPEFFAQQLLDILNNKE